MEDQAVQLEGARCANHPDAAATLVCARCGDHACANCAAMKELTNLCCRCAPGFRRTVLPTRRLMAVAIDGAIASALVLFIMLVPALLAGNSDFVRYALLGVGVLGVLCYWTVQWRGVARTGQSLGKRAVGIRLVRMDGTQPSVWSVVLLRNLLPMCISAVPVAGQLFAIVNLGCGMRRSTRCLHDVFADTLVVDAGFQQRAQVKPAA